MILIIAHKVYGLIAHFPDTVTKWIGQQLHSLGEGGDEARVQGMYKSMTGSTEQAINRGGGAIAGALASKSQDEGQGQDEGQKDGGENKKDKNLDQELTTLS